MSTDLDSNAQRAPKIEFPCLYPIKIIGNAVDDFQERAVAAVERYTGTITPDLKKVQTSREKNYLSVTMTIAASGEEQLQSSFQELKKIESVKMVL